MAVTEYFIRQESRHRACTSHSVAPIIEYYLVCCKLFFDQRSRKKNGEPGQASAFITDQKCLLFCFRKPAVTSGGYSRGGLKKDFQKFNEPGFRERTVKLFNQDDADRLLACARL